MFSSIFDLKKATFHLVSLGFAERWICWSYENLSCLKRDLSQFLSFWCRVINASASGYLLLISTYMRLVKLISVRVCFNHLFVWVSHPRLCAWLHAKYLWLRNFTATAVQDFIRHQIYFWAISDSYFGRARGAYVVTIKLSFDTLQRRRICDYGTIASDMPLKAL